MTSSRAPVARCTGAKAEIRLWTPLEWMSLPR
jgi:hypothetical protein